MKLLLFDIDGTILNTHGAGRRSVERALSQVFDRSISTRGVVFSGKTDPQILHEVLRMHGIDPGAVNGAFEAGLHAYAEVMCEELQPERITLLPGVSDLIARLADTPGLQLGLLTGNLETMAYLKLEAVGLAEFFPFGAFGSDHADRYQLPPIAVRRAFDHTGHAFAGKNIVILGDTEHDVLCGRALDVCAVAVCTGHYPRETLATFQPDLLLDDLSDPTPLLHLLLPESPA
jgi:phosphoglycolate phosphatase-like HAD superfamily hydrolase